MRKIFLTFCFTIVSFFAFAQTNFEKVIEEKAKRIPTAKNIGDFDKLFQDFSDLKTTQDPYNWKAYYYAGLVLYKKAEFVLSTNKKNDVKNINSLAEKFTLASSTVQPDNTEVNELLDLIKNQKLKLNDQKLIVTK